MAEYEVSVEDGYVLVQTSGACTTTDDFLGIGIDAHRVAVKNKLARMLFDLRGLTETNVDALLAVKVAAFFEQFDQSTKTIKSALVVKESSFKRASFAETAFQNRGIPLRAFVDMEESKQWLGV